MVLVAEQRVRQLTEPLDIPVVCACVDFVIDLHLTEEPRMIKILVTGRFSR